MYLIYSRKVFYIQHFTHSDANSAVQHLMYKRIYDRKRFQFL